MTAPALTKAQERALDWLPGDGSWKAPTGLSLTERRVMTSLLRLDLTTCRFNTAAPSLDEMFEWRLTPEGQALKRARALSEMAAMDGRMMGWPGSSHDVAVNEGWEAGFRAGVEAAARWHEGEADAMPASSVRRRARWHRAAAQSVRSLPAGLALKAQREGGA